MKRPLIEYLYFYTESIYFLSSSANFFQERSFLEWTIIKVMRKALNHKLGALSHNSSNRFSVSIFDTSLFDNNVYIPIAPHITIFIKPWISYWKLRKKKESTNWKKRNFLNFHLHFSLMREWHTYTHDNQRLLKNVIRYF